MYMRIQIHDIDGGALADGYEHYEEGIVLGYVDADGDEIDMAAFVAPRVVYVSREELDVLPA